MLVEVLAEELVLVHLEEVAEQGQEEEEEEAVTSQGLAAVELVALKVGVVDD